MKSKQQQQQQQQQQWTTNIGWIHILSFGKKERVGMDLWMYYRFLYPTP